MNNQRIRNLTTGLLHTEMGHIYEDIEYLIGEKGIMTHMIPRAFRALQPFLKSQIPEPRFWDDKYDTTHDGETELRPLSEVEKAEFWDAYKAQPNPLDGKDVIVVKA